MYDGPDIASVGALIGQPARANMLLLLLDGRGRTATELADSAGITRPTASSHLGQLVDGGLVRVDRQGRHRYFRLAGTEVAGLLESLLVIAGTPEGIDQRFGPRPSDMRRARMCYDHLAGSLGVGLADGLIRAGALVEAGDNFQLTADGERLLAGFGVDVEAARRRRRHFARTCIDWSERRPHLAGALGAALAERLFDLNWIQREPESRTLHITAAGTQGLSTAFGVEIT
jgi:DNA-binding transcriptional ArsR family regulator